MIEIIKQVRHGVCREVADGFLSKKLCSVAALSMVGNMMLFCKFCQHYPTTLT